MVDARLLDAAPRYIICSTKQLNHYEMLKDLMDIKYMLLSFHLGDFVPNSVNFTSVFVTFCTILTILWLTLIIVWFMLIILCVIKVVFVNCSCC